MLIQLTFLDYCWTVFLFIWGFFDTIFSFITLQVGNVFNAVPDAAVQFVIAILTYGTLALIAYWKEKKELGIGQIALNIVYVLILILSVLFTFWRFGFVMLLEEKVTATTVTEFFINLVYALIAIGIVYVFYKSERELEDKEDKKTMEKIKWILKITIWACFIVITFIICPIFEGFLLTFDLIYIQTPVLIFWFALPHGLYGWENYKKGGMRE